MGCLEALLVFLFFGFIMLLILAAILVANPVLLVGILFFLSIPMLFRQSRKRQNRIRKVIKE